MAVRNFQSPVINNISVSTVTDWISRCHTADICSGSDIMVILVVWPCGPDWLQDFLTPHVTDSEMSPSLGVLFIRKGPSMTCKFYLHKSSPHRLPP